MTRFHNVLLPTLIVFLAFIAVGCVKNEFTLDIKLDSSVSGNYRLQYYASDKRTGFWMEAIAPVEKGVAKTLCITRNPTIVFIFSPGSSKASASFYVERGDKIKITGSSPDPLLWQVGGNKINEDLTSFRLKEKNALSSGDSKRINAAIAAYAKKNPNSEATGILLLTMFDRRADEDGFVKIWNGLGEKARSENIVRLVGRADQLNATKEGSDWQTGSIKLHAMGDSLVEVDPRKADATLLYFRRSEGENPRETTDSLRSLTKADGFDKYGRIAAISFESDSSAWLIRARNDSLEKVTHAWMPAAENSPVAQSFGVRRTPFYVVADRKGKILYRGDKLEEAVNKFRTILKAGAALRRKKEKSKSDSIAIKNAH